MLILYTPSLVGNYFLRHGNLSGFVPSTGQPPWPIIFHHWTGPLSAPAIPDKGNYKCKINGNRHCHFSMKDLTLLPCLLFCITATSSRITYCCAAYVRDKSVILAQYFINTVRRRHGPSYMHLSVMCTIKSSFLLTFHLSDNFSISKSSEVHTLKTWQFTIKLLY